ncbi:Nif11-like leader peptide family natural product precursor [Prochlorococcus marinus]|uniref:Nif11 domain-containing protein n=1 Tax=Prochlorococcus marinus (strain MIT 9211) TaxID=93059 RepID=A9BAZ1_PROM4|nr:Nif11-like leader peptide family natural product precursor [Prochlorococcus marinus]ABX09003.1 Hypothetical protein P9211_10721 [Prochlorococcus marinus str. MIT 9211]
MSKEELSNFLYAAEHSYLLRRELKDCQSDSMILALSKKYGYKLSQNDLIENKVSDRIEEWFIKSRIKPIKSSSN